MSSKKDSIVTAREFTAKFSREALAVLLEQGGNAESPSDRASAYVHAAEKLGVSRWETMAMLITHAQAVADGFEAERIELLADLFAKVRANPVAAAGDDMTHWLAIGARTEEGEVGAAGLVLYAATMQARSEGESPVWDGSGVVEDIAAAAAQLARYEEGRSLPAALAFDLPSPRRVA